MTRHAGYQRRLATVLERTALPFKRNVAQLFFYSSSLESTLVSVSLSGPPWAWSSWTTRPFPIRKCAIRIEFDDGNVHLYLRATQCSSSVPSCDFSPCKVYLSPSNLCQKTYFFPPFQGYRTFHSDVTRRVT